ncbi:MAG: FRG domain-containing protein [Saprospiraceae bacterium]
MEYKKNWYRGHSKCYGNLTPRIFREEFNSDLHQTVSDNLEIDVAHEFKRIAPSLSTSLPKSDDYLSWLILMQHHGTPTRLLDWSQNILVATFFAVSDNVDEDGEIWTFYPQYLNNASVGVSGFPTESNPFLRDLALDPFMATTKNEEGKKPLAFFPIMAFSRMTAQQSVFTIHPKPDGQNSMEAVLTMIENDPEIEIAQNVRRQIIDSFSIPKSAKREILDSLITLGVSYRTLFPDLDHLSMDFVQKYKNPFWNVWGQPARKL